MNPHEEDHRIREVVPDLRREWMVIVRRRRLLIGLTLLSLSASLVYSYGVLPLYESSAVISISQTVPNQPLARLSLTAQRLAEVVEREITRMTSREFAAALFTQLGPRERDEITRRSVRPWYNRFRFLAEAETPAQMDPASGSDLLLSRLAVEPKSGSSWVEIKVLGFDPEMAAAIANAAVAAYMKETEEANRQTIEASRAALETSMETQEKKLGDQLSGLRGLATEGNQGDLNVRREALQRQIRGFQDALVAAQTARVGQAATRRDAAEMDASSLAADPAIQAAQARVNELEDRNRQQLTTLGAMHPDVVAVEAQLEAARTRLKNALAAAQRAPSIAYDLAVKEEARIQSNLQRLQSELSDLDKESLSYTVGAKKAEASRIALEQMIQRLDTAAPTILTTEVIREATAPSEPASPRPARNLLAALVGGLIAGLTLAWGLDRFDDSIQSPDDVKDILGLPFLGVVPLVPHLPHGSIAAGLDDTRTGFSDGLRVVRTNIVYGSVRLRPKVLVFTSASPGEGKSTVAAAIAMLLHETQARVLLIDGDLRRPTVHTLFEVSTETGLSDLLAQEPPITLKAAQGAIDVLPAGPPLTVSAARLGSPNMRSLLDQAREKYDWVIIDSPPSLGLPDASVLATLADGVVIICSGDKTPRQALRSVTDQLRSVGAQVIGVVLNRVNMDRHSYYYGRYYSAYYGAEGKAAQKSA